jgi:5-methylcytosine-specific restriction protein B
LSNEELDLRRERMSGFIEAWRALPGRRDLKRLLDQRSSLGVEALDLTHQFIAGTLDLTGFRDGIGSWARGKPIFGFSGPAGAMFLNQLVSDGADRGSELLLRRLLAPPSDVGAATVAIDELASFTEDLRAAGSAAQVGRVPFFLSWFWSLQDTEWRPMWPSADNALQKLGWADTSSDSQGRRFADYDLTLRNLSQEVLVNEEVLSWLGTDDFPVGFDTTLLTRCARALELPRVKPTENAAKAERHGYEENLRNIRSALSEMTRLGKHFAAAVAEELGWPVTISVPSEFWVPSERRLRADVWLSWRLQLTGPMVGVRIHCGRDGVHFVMNPESNRNPKGYAAQALEVVKQSLPEGWELFKSGVGDDTDRLLPWPGEDRNVAFNAGCRVEVGDIASADGLEQAVRRFAREARPVVSALLEPPPPPPTPPEGGDLDLGELARRFLAESGYPIEEDARQIAGREETAQLLAKDRLPSLTKDAVRRIIANRYGSPGPQAILNATIRDADETEWARFLQTVEVLLWGNDADTVRINRVLDETDLGFRGLKEGVVMKLLAITNPEQFIPVYAFSGDKGKAAMLRLLGQPVPSLQLSPGERQVQANDTLRDLLEPFFPGDPWAKMEFLYWYLDRQEPPPPHSPEDGVDQRLEDAAERLYLDREFLDDIVSLLREKRQVIFYGPPGTGKTFVAQALAEALAPEPERRQLVQFHPSTTYEDFFEGYRPDPAGGGGITYRLAPGPLRNLADAAEADPDRPYILIIDEINRSNLPKVFGELLFLLEYRDTPTRVLYRPDAEFRLPGNLWIIGTMNTADRSIALLDAAVRRRFHFIPFIPDVAGRSPISKVLRRWVTANKELETLPDIVDKVNNQLRVALGGDHLLLGPSYFMKKGIDEEALRRIWAYQIEPLIEDLFFGEPARVDAFRFDRVWAELGAPAIDAAREALQEPTDNVSDAEDSPG